MRRIIVIFVILLPIVLNAKEADIVYTDGYVDLKYESGERVEAIIGDYMETGDTIITEEDSYATHEVESAATIQVSPETVFTFQELEQGGESRSVFSTTLGAVGFKLGRLTGKEPLISTPGMTAGVRGTEFQVFAGSDGATLVVVESGSVVVESLGKSVELLTNEAVEVEVGEAPGDKFTVEREQLDFSEWNGRRMEEILEDPVTAIEGIEKGLEVLRQKIVDLLPRFEENVKRLEEERKILRSLEDDEDKDAQKKYYTDVVFPLEVETSYMRLNLRYHALSALSFRRFVLGGMYVSVKAHYMNRIDDPEFQRFTAVYRGIRAIFDRDVQPLLVEADF